MTNEQAMNMLKAKLECLKRETSGTDFDCNNSNCDECSLCYEQGNMGEQKGALDMAIKALEQQPCGDTISRQAAIDALTALEEPAPTARHLSGIYDCEDAIKALPSAQPEIIRCKDCKHWRAGTAFSYCDKLYGMGVLDALDYMVAEDDYCSMAERRTDE